MENIKEKFFNLFKDDKKRVLGILILILPFLIIIGICGFKIYGEAKSLLSLAVEDETPATTDTSKTINDGSFVLRDNSTEIQNEYFKELKDMYENTTVEATPEEKAVSTVKNFVADFYTWSNKAGQYDVGGMYYVYTPQRKQIYIQARDQFYKYINQYINEYGSDALLEVASVEATNESSEFEFDFDDQEFSAYKVAANWTYVEKEGGFSSTKYDTNGYFLVINNNERYEIAYISNEDFTIYAEQEN